MAITITNTKTVTAERMTMLVYGNPGAGKTSLAKTIQGRVLILSAESGLLSLSGTEMDVIEIGSWADVQEAYGWIVAEPRPYDWIFIDSLTELGQRLVEDMKRIYPDRKDSIVMWGEVADRMRAFIKAFRDLRPYSVVFTALAKIDKDAVGRRFTGVDLNGKIADQLPAFFDEVFALRILEAEDGTASRWLVTSQHDDWVAKDRSGQLALFEPPDLAGIARKIIGPFVA